MQQGGGIQYDLRYDPFGAAWQPIDLGVGGQSRVLNNGLNINNGSESPSTIGYAGSYTTGSGLLYLHARYADPTTGSFLSQDPVQGVIGGASVTFNPYPYAQNNSVNMVDPNGEFPFVNTHLGMCHRLTGKVCHPEGASRQIRTWVQT